jgi:ABC-type sugar transport system permease subunit
MKTQKNKFLLSEARDAYILLSPFLLLLLVFILYPVIINFYFSLTKWKGFGSAKWVGLANFTRLLGDERFWKSIANTFIISLSVPLGTLVPLFIAAILRGGLKGWSIFKTIIYLPNIFGYVIVGIVFNAILRVNGPVNSFIQLFNPDFRIDWLNDPNYSIFTVTGIFGVWTRIGFGCIYFLAAMSSINPSLYDAAEIDGANWFTIFFNVTLPSIRFSIEFWIVFCFIEIFARTFPFIQTFSNGGPGYNTFTMEFAIYDIGFKSFSMGYASSWAVVLFLFCSVIAFMQVRLMRRQ